MGADALDPCVSRTSAAMALIMQDKQACILHKEQFQLAVPFQCWVIIENENIFLCFLKQIQHQGAVSI